MHANTYMRPPFRKCADGKIKPDPLAAFRGIHAAQDRISPENAVAGQLLLQV